MHSFEFRPGFGDRVRDLVQLPRGTVLAVATALRNSIHQRTFDRGIGTDGRGGEVSQVARREYSEAHAERRKSKGRRTNKVDHSFTGAMGQGFRVLSFDEEVAHIGNADHTAARAAGTDNLRPWRVPSDNDREAARETLREILDGARK